MTPGMPNTSEADVLKLQRTAMTGYSMEANRARNSHCTARSALGIPELFEPMSICGILTHHGGFSRKMAAKAGEGSHKMAASAFLQTDKENPCAVERIRPKQQIFRKNLHRANLQWPIRSLAGQQSRLATSIF